jgi:hypothetical protein
MIKKGMIASLSTRSMTGQCFSPSPITPKQCTGNVVYITDDVSIWARSILHSAMDHWMSLTCLKFEKYDPNKHDENRLVFEKGKW